MDISLFLWKIFHRYVVKVHRTSCSLPHNDDLELLRVTDSVMALKELHAHAWSWQVFEGSNKVVDDLAASKPPRTQLQLPRMEVNNFLLQNRWMRWDLPIALLLISPSDFWVRWKHFSSLWKLWETWSCTGKLTLRTTIFGRICGRRWLFRLGWVKLFCPLHLNCCMFFLLISLSCFEECCWISVI